MIKQQLNLLRKKVTTMFIIYIVAGPVLTPVFADENGWGHYGGVPNSGGPIITASGLIFNGAALDDYIRAYNLSTGKELWKARLPAGGQSTPMTYCLDRTGQQYVVIAAGGHGRLGSTNGDYIIAYALPSNNRPNPAP